MEVNKVQNQQAKKVKDSRYEKGWSVVKSEHHAQVLPKRFFRKARETESQIKYAKDVAKGQEAFNKTIEANRALSDLINKMMRVINQKYHEAKEYKATAKAFYRLIDMNIRFFRYAEIDQVKQDVSLTNGYDENALYTLQSNLLKLLNILKESINDANSQYYNELTENKEEIQEYGEEVVYIVAFAQNLESSLRFTARNNNITGEGEEGEGTGGIEDYYAIIERASATEAVEEVGDESEEFIEEAKDNLKSRFEDELDEEDKNDW